MSPPSQRELALLNAPPPEVVAQVETMLRQVLPWYSSVDGEGERSGRPLTERETQEALLLGVAQPEAVRVVVTPVFPFPQEKELAALLSGYGVGSPNEGGRTHGHTLFVKPRYASDVRLLRHELVHVSQIEALGMEGFLRRYLTELRVVGYRKSPLENDAASRWRRRGAPTPSPKPPE